MATLSADRNTIRRNRDEVYFPVAASTTLYKGQPVCLDASGNLVAASATTGLISVGVTEAAADNSTGLAAAIKCPVRAGCFLLDNSDSMTKTSIGSIVYFADNTSVQVSGTGKSPAGLLVDVEDAGCWVMLGHAAVVATTGLLTTANNLSDVATKLTALNNLLSTAAVALKAGSHSLDASTATTIDFGGATATAINLGRTGQLTEIKGGAKVDQALEAVGVLTCDTHAVVTGTLKTNTIDTAAAGALAVGGATATSVRLGTTATAIVVNCDGSLTVPGLAAAPATGATGMMYMTSAGVLKVCTNPSGATWVSVGAQT